MCKYLKGWKKENMSEIRKKKDGITLVALVITIVVILILAGVTVNVLVGDDGLIKQAKDKAAKTYESVAKGEVKQIVTEYEIANSGETLEEFLNTKVPSRLDEVKRKDDKTLIVKKNGYEIEVESDSRILTLDVETYVGIYDGKPHDVLTSVNATPGDVKIEYATDGKTFSEDMPTIMNASSLNVTVKASRTGYKTIMVTKVARVNKADGNLKLASTSGTYIYPTSGTFSVSENTGKLSVSTNNTNIATVSTNGSTVTVVPGTLAGKATITVISEESVNYTSKSATYVANVQNGTISLSATPYSGTYDGKAHRAITNVTVDPSDATLDYSTDGKNYSPTIPTITVISEESVNYTSKSATYVANVQNGTISLSATPYSGTYDGKAHRAITNVTVDPSDATLDYSTDGKNYSPTIPTITNTSSFTVSVRAIKAGYTTKVITETTKINKARGTLKLSATSGTSTNFNNVTFSVSGNTGSLSVSSSNSNFATASIRGNTVTVKPIMAGSATITVTSAATANYTAASATYKITINSAPFTASSGVGYYTDVNSDGVADGVIFVDLKNGASGTWEGQSYNYAAVSGTKSYKIVKKNYNGPFGTKDVLQPSGSGNKRFHVMALKDVDSNKYDFWGAQNKSGNGWTVPPWSAWAAFAAKMGLSMSGSGNYGQFKMSYIYWSSESFKGMFFDQNTYGCYVRFDGNGRAAFGEGVAESNWCYVRLQTTF